MLKLKSIATLKSFAFTNKAGGTGMSNWKWDEKFQGTAVVKVTKKWLDYETGYRFWGEAVSQDLKDYMARNANFNDQRIFFGEFEVQS